MAPPNRSRGGSNAPSAPPQPVKSKSVKQRIRDLERLLRKEDLPMTVRQAQERVLNSLKMQFGDKKKSELEKKVVKKYRMVKFFERRKLIRKIKTCEKKAAAGDEESSAQLSKLQSDLNYVTHFPKDQKYISLFPSTPLSDTKVIARRERIYAEINAAVAQGGLPMATFEEDGDDGDDAPKARGGNHTAIVDSEPEDSGDSDAPAKATSGPKNSKQQQPQSQKNGKQQAQQSQKTGGGRPTAPPAVHGDAESRKRKAGDEAKATAKRPKTVARVKVPKAAVDVDDAGQQDAEVPDDFFVSA